ncbi:MaoC family dehydratase [Subtercola lobariae]|uniref:MaoC family dehydratase n=1 Tax=Subtercola lobariae TaxID=1588641 RepID=A0A917F2E0_9MICO|nr:MaoC family dehydratase [Subtercola lobariae]GGF41671.1 MaoC family dehydratase [Subtercola lobariae]
MKIFDSIAAVEEAIGTHLGYSSWHTITQHQIDAFAAATGDNQWIHTDPVRAAAGPFGGTIAHGYLTVSLVSSILDEVYAIDGVGMLVNYGADRLRFPAVVPAGSRVRGGVELLEVTPVTLGHRLRTRVTIERDGGDKPVCVIDVLRIAAP